MRPRRHRMRGQARRQSATAWIRSGARITVPAYAQRYGVDRHTAHRELTEMGFPLPATAAKWAQRPPMVPRKAARTTDEVDDERFADPDWIWVGDRRSEVFGQAVRQLGGGAGLGFSVLESRLNVSVTRYPDLTGVTW